MTDAMPNLARLTFHDDDTRFDISSLPEPGESGQWLVRPARKTHPDGSS